MKKNIVIIAYGSAKWIGGVYYKKNILYSLLSNEDIVAKYNIVLCTTKDLLHVFKCFEGEIVLRVFPENKKLFYARVATMMLRMKNRYFYSFTSVDYPWLLNKKCVYWIPDFQYKHYPEYFSKEDIEYRDCNYSKIRDYDGTLILSSEDSKNDFVTHFGNNKVKVIVVPFVSYIEEEIKALDNIDEEKILNSFELERYNYIYIPNQFWKHKNHIVVLEAINYLLKRNLCDKKLKFVFTGQLEDYRNPDYILQVKEYFMDKRLENIVTNLGFLPREEQLVVMKNASFLIQPSLFEGWGTVLEDAKVLDKRVILSDISIHYEQKYDKCVLFRATDAKDLATKILENIGKEQDDNLTLGIERMKSDAKRYSQGLEIAFK